MNIEGTISSSDTSVILIPNSIILENEEYVYVTVPTDYYSPVSISYIGYQSDSSLVYSESDGAIVDLSPYAGKTVKLRHDVVRKSSYSEEIGFRFTLIE